MCRVASCSNTIDFIKAAPSCSARPFVTSLSSSCLARARRAVPPTVSRDSCHAWEGRRACQRTEQVRRSAGVTPPRVRRQKQRRIEPAANRANKKKDKAKARDKASRRQGQGKCTRWRRTSSVPRWQQRIAAAGVGAADRTALGFDLRSCMIVE